MYAAAAFLLLLPTTIAILLFSFCISIWARVGSASCLLSIPPPVLSPSIPLGAAEANLCSCVSQDEGPIDATKTVEDVKKVISSILFAFRFYVRLHLHLIVVCFPLLACILLCSLFAVCRVQ